MCWTLPLEACVCVCLLTPKQAIENIVNGVSMLGQLKVYII